MRMLLADDRRRLLNGEEVHRVITSMGADKYDGLSYYERWLHGFKVVLVEKGTITEAELAKADAALPEQFGQPTGGSASGQDDHHNHDHDHDHDHGHAPDHDDHDPFSPQSRRLAEALKTLLIEKEILTPDDIRRTIDFFDSRGAHLGAKAVARAWLDAGFKRRLLDTPMQLLPRSELTFLRQGFVLWRIRRTRIT